MGRIDKFTRELFNNPLFPLLFISETVKLGTLHLVGASPIEAVGIMALLSVPATWLWYHFGDDLEEVIDEKVDESED